MKNGIYLTSKQKRVYEFIRDYILAEQISPSYEEIRDYCGFSAVSTVFDYIRILERKGFINCSGPNSKRSLSVIEQPTDSNPSGRSSTLIPLLGTVAAGIPIDVFEECDQIEVPSSILAFGDNIALRVRGDSMIERGIHDGDIIVVRRQQSASDGDIVVALVDGRATVKRFFARTDCIELRPANAEMEPVMVSPDQQFEIYGILAGLYRRY